MNPSSILAPATWLKAGLPGAGNEGDPSNALAGQWAANVIWCEPQGRTKVYALNPRYPFLAELKALLARALEFYPPDEQEWLRDSRRPRRSGKPLTL